jgi:segregation and condensation protein B
VASGWRVQVRGDLAPWVSRLWESRPPKYSRALLETLVLIAYQQPVTRSDIEQVRGVSVSSNIIRTLLDRDWIRIVGHRDVPGRPALYGTTRAFLDYFDLRSLDQLPPLAEIRDLARINEELGFDDAGPAGGEAGQGDGSASPGGADRPAPEPEGGHEVVPISAVLGQFETPDDSGAVPEDAPDSAATTAVPPSAIPDPDEDTDDSGDVPGPDSDPDSDPDPDDENRT